MPKSPEQPRFDSISHFLESGNFDYRVFDMGRKVTLFSHDVFKRIETQELLYPYPFQKKSSLALLLWSRKESNEEKISSSKEEAVIWFLQFPIDELGYLQLESRDGFLLSLLEQASKNIEAKLKGTISTDEMSESPFAFQPTEDRLAMFHAFATRELGQQPSHYYQATREYLKGSLGYEHWQFLGLQGIADVVARLDGDGNEDLLNKALSKLPDVPLESFCRMLENTQPKEALTQNLIGLINKQANTEKPAVAIVAALLRGLSGAKLKIERKAVLLNLLGVKKANKLAGEIEILATISGRCWLDLESDELLELFIESLAEQDQAGFNAILFDLIMMPKMRKKVLAVGRGFARSKALDEKMTVFMTGYQA